jgi:dihydrofolate reductase
MRKLIVSNMVTLDGFYEGKGRSLPALFEYEHSDYASDDAYDHYNTALLRASDTLILSGHKSFHDNQEYWTGTLDNPKATAVRREYAALMREVDKVVVSDQLTDEELGAWSNTRIVKRADAAKAVTALKKEQGRDIFIFAGRILWNALLLHGLVDELHIATFPLVAGEGTPLFIGRPDMAFKLIGTQTRQGSGIVISSYAPSRLKK